MIINDNYRACNDNLIKLQDREYRRILKPNLNLNQSKVISRYKQLCQS